jgi:hypothetical protein
MGRGTESYCNMTVRIKNWRKFQHFKNRRPPWIKLYRDLLDDPYWHDLRGDTAKHLVMLWLIASEDHDREGKLPEPRALAFMLRIDENQVPKLLRALDHWIYQDDVSPISERCHDDAPESEESRDRVEGETEKKTGKILLPDDWRPSVAHYELAKKKGLPMEAVDEAADEMRSWSLGNGERRTNWDWVFNNWLRRIADRRKNGFGRRGTLQDDSRSASRAAGRLAEQAERGEFGFGPRPGLLPAANGDNVVLLPKGRDA